MTSQRYPTGKGRETRLHPPVLAFRVQSPRRARGRGSAWGWVEEIRPAHPASAVPGGVGPVQRDTKSREGSSEGPLAPGHSPQTTGRDVPQAWPFAHNLMMSRKETGLA